MDKINFTNGKDGKTPVSADNLNQLQTNVENGIKQGIDSRCVYLGDCSLFYLNSKTLSSNITINGLGSIENKSIVLISCLAMDGTPYDSIINFSYKINGDKLTINAHAQSFVEGHVLAVKVLVYYNG